MVQTSPKQKEVFYSDFLFDFKRNPNTNDLVRVTNEQSVINSLKKIIKTNHYEVPYAPFFGANIYRYLFEPMVSTTEFQVKSDIKFAIEQYEPRVEILDIVVNGRPDNNAMDITLTFSIINNPAPITITTSLIRIR
jgi:phage baseplate assembly protein W